MDKCIMNGNILTPCDGANRIVRGQGEEIGINTNTRVSLDTDQTTQFFLTYHMSRGKKAKKWLVKFCPSCGVNILPERFTVDETSKDNK